MMSGIILSSLKNHQHLAIALNIVYNYIVANYKNPDDICF